jgi:hypothetical protein
VFILCGLCGSAVSSEGAKEILSLQTILSPLAGLFLPASFTGGSQKKLTAGYFLITPPGLEPLIFSHDRRDRREIKNYYILSVYSLRLGAEL